MPKKSSVHYKYNPALSVKKNAELCGVSEASIRKYIKANNIDRRRDSALFKQQSILALKEKNPDISIAEIIRQTGYSFNTIKKYLTSYKNPSIIDTNKVSRFDVSNKTVIKSVSDNQEEILYNILRLYVKSDRYDCDFTYSIGNFYKNIPKPNLKFDKYPRVEGVQPLEEAENIPDGSLNSVVVDLPFIVKNHSHITEKSLIINRFECFDTAEELYQANDDMVSLSYRVLAKGGYLIVKTMDTCSYQGQIWTSEYVYNKAKDVGFEMVDKFILTFPFRYIFYKGKQRHARKYHSYFLIFRKHDFL